MSCSIISTAVKTWPYSASIAGRSEALILFVPARSVAPTLSEASSIMGQSRRAVIARELTKVCLTSASRTWNWLVVYRMMTKSWLLQVHEEVIRGTLGELYIQVEHQQLKVRGPKAQTPKSDAPAGT